MKKIIKSVAVVTIISIATRGLSFVYRIILSRNFTSEMLGQYQIAMSVFMVLFSITSSGMPLAISRLVSQNASKTKDISQIATSGVIVGAIFSCLCIITLLCFSNILSSIFIDESCYSILLYFLPALVASSFYSSFRGMLWGSGKFFQYSLIELIDEFISIATLILMFYYINFDIKNLHIPAISVSISYIVASIFSAVFYFKNGGRLTIPRNYLSTTLRISSPITFVRVLASFSSSILALLLPARLTLHGMSQSDALSLIGLVNGVAFPLLFVPSSLIGSLALVLVPEIADDVNKGRNVSKKIRNALMFGGIISSLIVPLYITLGEEICQFLFLKGDGGKYLSISAILMVPLCLNQLASSFLNSSGGEKYNFKNFIVGGCIALTCVIFLTPIIGIYSIILSMFAQSFIVFTLNCRNLSKHLNLSFFAMYSNLKYVIIAFPSCIVAFAIKNMISTFSIFATILIVGTCLGLFLLLILYIILPINFENLKKSRL